MKRILIANRGEIALRIIRTCKSMGIETVAVYSDADAHMPYVREATKAIRIGEPPVQKSYLRGEKILAVAQAEKVDGIHPGYGFLSENSVFAKEVITNGFTFIGPSPEVIELMGSKLAARSAMKMANVPLIPGSGSEVKTLETASELANTIGYPIMLKASGGGGGIGMHLCKNEGELKKVFASTKARAMSYFGNDQLYIEKYIKNARHIEVQVFGDQKGNVVHLFERDCSIQRRNQKVVEESPSPFLSKDTRGKLCQTAVRAAKAVGYYNAGTIEFILDEHEQFYFLEMNTRLQVEHPVTEEMTGIDLVSWQIRIARGEELPLKQAEIKAKRHAIEFRVYAEDPMTFLPSPGLITAINFLQNDCIRVDSGYSERTAVTPYYDPMIAKVIISGKSRPEAIKTAEDFFEKAFIGGIKTNLPLFQRMLKDKAFTEGDYSTNYLHTIYPKK